MSDYTPTWFEIRERLEHDTWLTADEADRWLAEHDAQVRAEEREKCARIAERSAAAQFLAWEIADRIRANRKEQNRG